jgi:hypothetical protein
MDVESECQESIAITFEWTLKWLQKLFDSTKGESKSKVTKSARFGGGRWQVCFNVPGIDSISTLTFQILFYANAGTAKEGSTEGGGYVSLYLSCEVCVVLQSKVQFLTPFIAYNRREGGSYG